jgi:hypothetical protein
LATERVERRLAAILAADVAGYSRPVRLDEEGTLERLKALRRELLDPKIAEHHGRIVKTTRRTCSRQLTARAEFRLNFAPLLVYSASGVEGAGCRLSVIGETKASS